ncbi:MAG: dTDP-glucose 4,6-dehydratase [Planctomycetaceae bacterium]
MKSILVTGGCGFIGSNFIRMQRELYPEQTIHNIDKLTYAGNLENLADLEQDPHYHFHHVDICDHAAIQKLLAEIKVDAILNFAAESHVDRSILDSGPFVQTNVIGTQVLMDVAREQNIPRYLQVSTDEVYGSLGSEGYFTETTPLAPNSPYSSSKAAADLLVRSYVHTFDFPAVITRCSNNYGPYQFPEKLIPLFISNALENKSLPVYGTGENVRDWIHVLDHCRGIDAALRKGNIGEVYNFGGHHELTNLEMTHILIDLLGKSRDLITFVQDRPGHDLRYAIDCSKAERELGWTPQVPFEQGIRDTISWYQSHTDWVKRIKTGEYLQYLETQYANRLKK